MGKKHKLLTGVTVSTAGAPYSILHNFGSITMSMIPIIIHINIIHERYLYELFCSLLGIKWTFYANGLLCIQSNIKLFLFYSVGENKVILWTYIVKWSQFAKRPILQHNQQQIGVLSFSIFLMITNVFMNYIFHCGQYVYCVMYVQVGSIIQRKSRGVLFTITLET